MTGIRGVSFLDGKTYQGLIKPSEVDIMFNVRQSFLEYWMKEKHHDPHIWDFNTVFYRKRSLAKKVDVTDITIGPDVYFLLGRRQWNGSMGKHIRKNRIWTDLPIKPYIQNVLQIWFQNFDPRKEPSLTEIEDYLTLWKVTARGFESDL